jgi:molecular chaperone GrpE
MEEAAKEALTARFRAYLDSIAETEGTEGPEASDQPPDLFTLLAEVSTLRAEVRLESRQFKTALDEFRAVFDAVREANARLDDEQERRREQERKASRESQKDQLLELLDLRDRLQAGYEQATRFRPGWLGGHRAAEFVKAMAEGMGMNLRRFDEVLGRRGVRPLPAIGKPFDPLTMHAAEVAKDPAQPEGRVVRELRKGFLLGDTLLRPAEVAVNRPAGDSADR